MKAEIINITSGPAGGKQMIEVSGRKGKIGFIQPTHLDASKFGCTTIFISAQYKGDYGMKACYTLADAFAFLGVNIDKVELPNGVFCEFQDEFYRLTHSRAF